MSIKFFCLLVLLDFVGNQELKNEYHEWNEIEDHTSVETSHEAIREARNFMEGGSFAKLYDWGFVLYR